MLDSVGGFNNLCLASWLLFLVLLVAVGVWDEFFILEWTFEGQIGEMEGIK
jgi:hypothetical protein